MNPNSTSLPPYDVVSLENGIAFLIELATCQDLELYVTNSGRSFRLTGKKDTRPALPLYTGHMHNGRESGRFCHEFDLPVFYEIDRTDKIEVTREEDGVIVVVVRKDFQPCQKI